MNEDKELLEKIAKVVGLSKDSVELVDLVDLMGISKNINGRVKDMESDFKKFIASKDSLENNIVPLNLDIEKGKKASAEIERKIKELGLSEKQVPELKVVRKALKEGFSFIKDIKSEL